MPEKQCVLLVDDDSDFRFQQKLALEAAGYEVVEAVEAGEALDWLMDNKPDVALFDLMMEESDAGFMLCYETKRRYPDLPIIMVTAVASETGIDFDAATEEERAWLKADLLLRKPLRFEQLDAAIKKLTAAKT